MTEQSKAQIANNKPGLDALVEDLFGLNFRGMKTIMQLFVSPKEVFESARVSDWRRQYTPTMRLTFSIITVFMLLSFFWAAEDGIMYQTLLAQMTEAAASDPGAPDPKNTLDARFGAYSFLYPFVYMLVHGLVGSIVFFWGDGTEWVTRVRLYFALLATGMLVALMSMAFVPFLTTDALPAFTLIGLFVSVLIYGLTYARGMWGTRSHISILVRAVLIALIITSTDLLISVLSGISARLWVTQFGA